MVKIWTFSGTIGDVEVQIEDSITGEELSGEWKFSCSVPMEFTRNDEEYVSVTVMVSFVSVQRA
jgi:hypothetical protein